MPSYPFVFGETPAQAARMGYEMAERNRAADIAAQDRTAQFAFQTYGLENQQAQQIAALEAQRQREQNQLDQVAYQEAAGRFQFGKNLEAQKRAEDWNKFTFDANQKAADRTFQFNKDLTLLERNRRDETIENEGNALAASIGELSKPYQDALKLKQDADLQIDATRKAAQLAGYKIDRTGTKFEPISVVVNGNVEAHNSKLTQHRTELDEALKNLIPIVNQLKPLEHQARALGFTINPDGSLTNLKTGKTFRRTPSQPAPPPQTGPTNSVNLSGVIRDGIYTIPSRSLPVETAPANFNFGQENMLPQNPER